MLTSLANLIIGLFAFLAIATNTKAEDPMILGLRGALSALSPVPEETSYSVRSNAAGLLAGYVKKRDGTYLSEMRQGTLRTWMEMRDLHLTRVTACVVSQADAANGSAERFMVSVDCEMYRLYDSKAAKWSQWHNGRNPFMPPSINVERKTTGQWIPSSPLLSRLIMFSAHGDPNTIPHGPKAAPKRSTTLPTAPQPARAVKAPPVPITAKPATTDGTSSSWRGTIGLLTIIAAFSAFLNSIKSKKGSGKRGRARRSRRPTPPPLRINTTASQPPPLPVESQSHDFNPIDLIERKETLMTAAEQAFFDVLEPLVRSSCRVSSNVRLLDLFEVRRERGQQSAFNKISRKHIDFVLTENGSSRILCAIELDDSSHQRPDRIERDAFVNELFASRNLPLLRIPFAWTYNVPGLRDVLLKAGVSLSNAA